MDQAATERKAHLEQLTLAIRQLENLVKNGHNLHHETGDAATIAQLENLVIMLAQIVLNNYYDDDRRDVTRQIADLRPDSYWGKEDHPIELERWIRHFEKIFTIVNCPDDRKVRSAAYYFKGEANYWWYANKDVFLAGEKNFDWEAFKAALRARFFPNRVKLQKCEELTELKQEGMSVTDYYHKFTELFRLVGDLLPDDEAMKVCRFVRGLNLSIQRYVFARDYATVHEAYDKAGMIEWIDEQERMERMHAKKRKAYGGGESSRGQAGGSFSNMGNDQNLGPERHYYCRKCQQDHPGVDCQGMDVNCYNCGELGHRAYECQGPT